MKKQITLQSQEYLASAFARSFLQDMKLRPGMDPYDIKERISDTYSESDQMELLILGTVFSGYMASKQAYLFSKTLIEDLKDSELNFHITDLHLPFESFFLDLRNYEKTLDQKRVLGCYIRNLGEPEHCICYAGLVQNENGGIQIMKGSLDYGNQKTLEEQIQDTLGGYEGETHLHHTIFALMAYLSSDKPDVIDTGLKAVRIKLPNRKTSLHATRMWNVGYRYMKEQTNTHAAQTTTAETQHHASPRPHMRKGHWHTFRCGPGRTQTRVRWVKEQQIGKPDNPDVIRIKTDKKEEPFT